MPTLCTAQILARVCREDLTLRWKFDEPTIEGNLYKDVYKYMINCKEVKSWLDHARDYVFGYPSIVNTHHKAIEFEMGKNLVRIDWRDGAKST